MKFFKESYLPYWSLEGIATSEKEAREMVDKIILKFINEKREESGVFGAVRATLQGGDKLNRDTWKDFVSFEEEQEPVDSLEEVPEEIVNHFRKNRLKIKSGEANKLGEFQYI